MKAKINFRALLKTVKDETQTSHNIRIYARLAEVLTMSCGAYFNSSCGLKELY
jgi:hypothetical protein